MKKYVSVEMEIHYLQSNSVIKTSGTFGTNGFYDNDNIFIGF